nr:unnamed protein product [Callosobruchus analis]
MKYYLDISRQSRYLDLGPCSHCDTLFKTKTLVDDHIAEINPDYFTSVTSKLHECSKCTYKTTIKYDYNTLSLCILRLPQVMIHRKLSIECGMWDFWPNLLPMVYHQT